MTASLWTSTLPDAAADTPEVVVVGASITEAWHVERLAQRRPGVSYQLSSQVRYEFDKAPLVQAIVARPSKPRAVILKECGAYFPGDQNAYRAQVKRWVAQLQESGIEPILATTLPVTESQPWSIYLKQLIKRYVLRSDYVDNDQRLQGIWEFNDWIKEYARKQDLRLLDLEAAVTAGRSGRSLPDEFTSGDGLHLNAQAYERLDDSLVALLASLPAVAAGK